MGRILVGLGLAIALVGVVLWVFPRPRVACRTAGRKSTLQRASGASG